MAANKVERATANVRRAEERAIAAAGAAQAETACREVQARRFWPRDKPLPDYYLKHRNAPFPCRNPKCRRVTLDDGRRALACTSSGADFAWFRCKVCGRSFQLPVRSI